MQSTADDVSDETTMNNTTMDEMGIPEEFLAGFAAAHELFGE